MRSPISDDGDVDRLLSEAGRRWRADQPAPPQSPIPSMLLSRRRRFVFGRAGSWAAAVAGVATVAAAIAIPLALQRATDPGNLGPAGGTGFSALPPDSGKGVLVEGRGTLYRDGDGPIMLCDDVVMTMDLPTSSAGCQSLAVRTAGVDESLLTNVTSNGQAFGEPVRVMGSYHDGTLTVTSVVQAPPEQPAPFVEPPIPCPAPAGGWKPGYGLAAGDHQRALDRLAEVVRASPGRFIDVWEGHPDGSESVAASGMYPRMVYVVGVKGDPTKARKELAAIYQGNLCVHQVRHAQVDLQQIADRLGGVSSTAIRAEVDVMAGKVRVKTVALDPGTMTVLDQVDRSALAIEEPMLMWMD